MAHTNMYYFLAMKPVKDDPPHPSIALVHIKTSDDPNANPYIAFKDPNIGEKYIEYMNISKAGYLIPESELDPDDKGYNFGNDILVFESFEQILNAYSDQNSFDFTKLIKPYLRVVGNKT